MSNIIRIENDRISIQPLLIIKNPTLTQYLNLYNKTKEKLIRGIIDQKTKNFYIADAYYFYHEYMLEIIMEYYTINRFPYWCYKDDGTYISLENKLNMGYNCEEIVNKLKKDRLLIYDYNKKTLENQSDTYLDYLKIENETDAIEFLNKYSHLKQLFSISDLISKNKYSEKAFTLIVENKYNERLESYKENLY